MMQSNESDLIAFKEQIRQWGLELGLSAIGFAAPISPTGHVHYLDWLSAGRHAGMSYMDRQAEARRNPAAVLPDVATVIVAMLNYKPPVQAPPEPDATTHRGHIAAYAQGRDYHQIFWNRLGVLLEKIQTVRPTVQGRAVADSAPLMEREFAQLAGLGWIGKNTCLIHRQIGSLTLLGELLIDLPLPPDQPFSADHCGTCTRCIDACPTQALTEPYQLDANRCISYWTIEYKGLLSEEIGDNLNDWAFGCDICQQVCPWNRKSPPGTDAEILGDGRFFEPDLREWLKTPKDEIRQAIKGTALERTKRAGLVRNAIAILTANQVRDIIPDLQRLAQDDPDEVVRDSARQALNRLS